MGSVCTIGGRGDVWKWVMLTLDTRRLLYFGPCSALPYLQDKAIQWAKVIASRFPRVERMTFCGLDEATDSVIADVVKTCISL